MSQKIHPAAGVAIAIVVAVLIGLLSWKIFAAPQGLSGKSPPSMADPNGGGPPKPSGMGGGAPSSGGGHYIPGSGGSGG
jgi:hypothetical protein